MNSKIVTLIKMVILSLGLIAIVGLFGNHKEKKMDNSGANRYDFAMGTSISVSLYDTVDADIVADRIFDDIKALDEELLSWRVTGSEVNTINARYEVNEKFQISEELNYVLEQCVILYDYSEGALDFTIRPLAALWNIEGDESKEFVPPSKEEINKSLEYVGLDKVRTVIETHYSDDQALAQKDYYLCLTKADMILDFGAVGKGYALDKAREILQELEVGGALVTVGGSILVYGEKSTGEPWRIGVRDPLKPNDTSAMMGYIELPAGTVNYVSTSGGYEKFKTYEGKDYHHILDGKTGYPADSGLLSVTVVCDNGLVSDGLSTACFVLGYDKSLALLEKYNAQAVFMDSDGDIIVTDGLKDKWIEP